MRRPSIAVSAMLACLVLSAACDNSGSPSTSPTPGVSVTETFNGTVQPMSTDSHNFTITQSGDVTVTLTAAGPPATIFMGLGVGTPNATDGSCTLLQGASTSAQAGTTPQLAGQATAGTFCVSVFDLGNQTAAISYTVTVVHT